MTATLTAALIVAAVAARMWRLAAADTITAPLRRRLPPPVLHFVECGWCSTAWYCAAVTAAWHAVTPLDMPVLVWAAACLPAGWFTTRI